MALCCVLVETTLSLFCRTDVLTIQPVLSRAKMLQRPFVRIGLQLSGATDARWLGRPHPARLVPLIPRGLGAECVNLFIMTLSPVGVTRVEKPPQPPPPPPHRAAPAPCHSWRAEDATVEEVGVTCRYRAMTAREALLESKAKRRAVLLIAHCSC